MWNKIWYFIFAINFSICSTTYLWRIDRNPAAYIFGTMHISYRLIWPYVSNETQQAFFNSTHFYGEIDAKNHVFWDDFLECLMKKSSRTERSIPSKTYHGELLDIHLAVLARQMNKTVGSLETAQYHCEKLSWMHNITTWQRVVQIMKTKINENSISLSNIRTRLTKSAIKKYNCEEINGNYLAKLYNLDSSDLFLDERDEQMSNSIHTLLQRSKTNRYFFAIGAAHMLRKNQNLIVRVRKLGYNVTRVCTNRKRTLKKYGCKTKKIRKHCIK